MTPRDRSQTQAGMTLIEMLVVIGVLAAATLLVAPRIQAARAGEVMRAAVTELAAAARGARAAAMRTGREQTLILDAGNVRYQMAGGPERALPATVSMRARDASGAPVPLARVVFHPDGSASGLTVHLADTRASAQLTIDWLTGATAVRWNR